MDSERQPIPALLKQTLSLIGGDNMDNISEAALELQKSNNCGLEVIENFMLYSTNHKLDQDDTLIVHSLLLEDSLLLGEAKSC